MLLRRELTRLLHLAVPLLLQNVVGYSTSVVAIVFMGQLNDPAGLSAVVLANSLYNVSGYSLVIGLAAGMETLCGQAFGAKSYKTLGLVLQQALLICWLACVPVSLLWYCCEPILSWLHQAPEIVRGAAIFIRLAIPSLYVQAASSCLYRFLLAQRAVLPGMVCAILSAVLCPVLNYWFLWRWNWGVVGAAYAFVYTNAAYTMLLAAYVLYREVQQHGTAMQTWPGLSWSCMQGWGLYLTYGLPSTLGLISEWWLFEVVIFLAGTFANAESAVAAMGITFNMAGWLYMAPMALGSATCTRIANELGAGHASAAKSICHTAGTVVLSFQMCMAALVFYFQTDIGRFFTASSEVLACTAAILPIAAINTVADGSNAVLNGVLRGSGHQAWGAALNTVGYWLVAGPLCLVLGEHLGLGPVGLWAGLAVGCSLQTVFFATFVVRLDWAEEVGRARALLDSHTGAAVNSSAAAAAVAVISNGMDDEQSSCCGVVVCVGAAVAEGTCIASTAAAVPCGGVMHGLKRPLLHCSGDGA